MEAAKQKAWAEIDAGKGFHWVVVLDAEGGTLLSRKVDNSEADFSALIGEALVFKLGHKPCHAGVPRGWRKAVAARG